MASVRYIVLAACQRAGLVAQAGFENEAAAWIRKLGSRPCAYVGYRRGIGVPGYDNVSVLFGGSEPQAALRRVREELDKSLEFSSETTTTVEGYPELVMTARVRKRIYNIFGGGFSPAPPTPPTAEYMYFEAAQANSTVSMMSMLATAPDLEYSTDGETWQEWQHTTAEGIHTFDTLTLTAVGDRVYLRGNNPNGFQLSGDTISFFSMTGKIAAHGNAQSLVDGDTPTLVAKTMPLFSDIAMTGQPNTVLVSAPDLPATTLTAGCYRAMFDSCPGLTQAPSLPATALAEGCYEAMLAGTGITQAPSLPATTLAESCYAGMFSGCTFAMSNDGTTFNFAFGATPPVTAGEETYNTYYDLANWMGNTNGFTTP